MAFHSFNPDLACAPTSTSLIAPVTTKTSNKLANLEALPNSYYEYFVLFLQLHPLSTMLSLHSVGINVNALYEFWWITNPYQSLPTVATLETDANDTEDVKDATHHWSNDDEMLLQLSILSELYLKFATTSLCVILLLPTNISTSKVPLIVSSTIATAVTTLSSQLNHIDGELAAMNVVVIPSTTPAAIIHLLLQLAKTLDQGENILVSDDDGADEVTAFDLDILNDSILKISSSHHLPKNLKKKETSIKELIVDEDLPWIPVELQISTEEA
ncbi:hypothetical protein L1887_42149 [Cichorium endivia]|nr:hypothetical protein L1887_42149 [Cichorium endivia]